MVRKDNYEFYEHFFVIGSQTAQQGTSSEFIFHHIFKTYCSIICLVVVGNRLLYDSSYGTFMNIVIFTDTTHDRCSLFSVIFVLYIHIY
jgi:hypothetical protein